MVECAGTAAPAPRLTQATSAAAPARAKARTVLGRYDDMMISVACPFKSNGHASCGKWRKSGENAAE